MQHVVVIGGGLAGCALAEAFSRRGWQVTVLEARDRLGGAVAGLPLIAQHPALTPDFDLRSRLLVAALQQHARLRAGPAADLAPAFEVCGRLQPMAAARAARCVAHVAAPVAQVWLAAAHPMAATPVMVASRRTGPAGQGSRTVQDELPPDVPGQPAQAGIWFPGCAAVSPARWWQQVRQRPQVTVRLGVKVGRIRKDAPASFGWQVFDTAGALLARADVVVLACQLDSFALADMQEADHGRLRLSAACAWTARADGGPRDEDPGHPALLPMVGGKGLVLTRPGSFWLRSDEAHRHWLDTGVLPAAVYWPGPANAAAPDGAGPDVGEGMCKGAGTGREMSYGTAAQGSTSQRGAAGGSSAWDDDALQDYLSRPESWLQGPVGERLQLRDNLPMIGRAPDLVAIDAQADALARNDRLPVPRRVGLHILTGMAGRGALYAAIGAEMIAADACGEPPVVEATLARAVDPARFIKRRLQRAWSRRDSSGASGSAFADR